MRAGPAPAAGSGVGAGRRRTAGLRRIRGLPWRGTLLAGLLAVVAAAGWATRVAPSDAVGAGLGETLPSVPTASPSAGVRASGAPSAAPTPGGETRPGVDPEPRRHSDDWWETVAALDRRRTDVLAAGDAAAVASYAAPGSRAAREDRQLIADLDDRGLRPEGLGSHLLAIESAEDRPNGGVHLQVVDERSPYVLVDRSSGAIAHRVAGAPATRWRIRLRPADEPVEGDPGWRVASVTRVAEAEGDP